jgi:integrase
MEESKQKQTIGYYRKRGKDSYELDYRRNRKTVKAKNDTEAARLLARFISEIDSGKFRKPSKMTLKQLSDRFLRDNPELSTATKNNYEIHLKERILPSLGDNKIDKIKPTHIYDFLNNLKEDGIRKDGKPGGLGAATIKKNYNILSSMFSFAVELGELEDNPCVKVKPPKIPKRKPVSLEKDLAIQLLQALANESLKYKVMVLLAACTGMRRGEILGIGDSTLNIDNCAVIIDQATRHIAGVGIYLKDPKTDGSIRAIPLPPSIMPLISEMINARDLQRKKCGDKWVAKILKESELVENDLLFTQWNGKPMHPNTVDGWFKKFKEDNNLPENLTFHGLRHTNITLLLKSGIDVGTVADNSGHTKKSTTLDYDDPSPEALREVANKINTVLNLQETVPGLLNFPVNIYRLKKKKSM